jgi:hypothetical protein
MNLTVRCAVRMERELRLWQPKMRGYLAAHARTIREKPVSEDSWNAASTPSPIPSACRSSPSAASNSAQKAMRSLSCRLYRLTVRSRPKSAAAALLSSVMPSNTMRGSISNHSRSSAQSRRVPTPSRQCRSEWPFTVPARPPRGCYEPQPRSPMARLSIKQTKATKCRPATVAGSLS